MSEELGNAIHLLEKWADLIEAHDDEQVFVSKITARAIRVVLAAVKLDDA